MSTLPKNANKSYQHLKTFFYLLDGSTKSVNGRFPKKAIKFEKKNLPLVLNLLTFVFQIMWHSHNILTLKPFVAFLSCSMPDQNISPKEIPLEFKTLTQALSKL